MTRPLHAFIPVLLTTWTLIACGGDGPVAVDSTASDIGATDTTQSDDAEEADSAASTDADNETTDTAAPLAFTIIDPARPPLGPLATTVTRAGPPVFLAFEGDLTPEGYAAEDWQSAQYETLAYESSAGRPGSQEGGQALSVTWEPGFAALLGPAPVMNDGQAYAVSFWIKPSVLDDAERTIVAYAPQMRQEDSAIHTMAIYLQGGRIVLDHFYVGAITTPPVVTEVDTWYHVTVSRAADATTTIFVNGAQLATGTLAGVNEGEHEEGPWPFYVGDTRNSAFPAARFEGLVDEFAVWPSQLGPDAAQGLYDFGLSVLVSEDDDGTLGTARSISTPDQKQAALDPSGDVDYYRFEATEGVNYIIAAVGIHQPRTAVDVDTVISIYDFDNNLLASNDDAGNRTGSELLWRAPATGFYAIRVEECWTAASRFGFGCFDPEDVVFRAYTLFVVEQAVATSAVFHDENNEVAPRAVTFVASETAGVYTQVALEGTFDSAADIDTFRFVVPEDLLIDGQRRPWVYVRSKPIGPWGSGATAKVGRLTLTREGQGQPWASIEGIPSDGDGDLAAPVVAGAAYTLTVRGRGEAGPNPEYHLWISVGQNNPFETEPANDVPSGANFLQSFADGGTTSFFFDGDLARDGSDTDYYLLQGGDSGFAVGSTLTLFCTGWQAGSALHVFDVTTLDANGDALATTSVRPTAIGWDRVSQHVLTKAESALYLRVDAPPVTTDVLSSHYFCGAHVVAP